MTSYLTSDISNSLSLNMFQLKTSNNFCSVKPMLCKFSFILRITRETFFFRFIQPYNNKKKHGISKCIKCINKLMKT